MKIYITLRTGVEVKIRGYKDNKPEFYGGPPFAAGEWKIDTESIQNYLTRCLGKVSFGDKVDEFVVGLQIAELESWGDIFTKYRNYISYSPKTKSITSVAQLEWDQVRKMEEPDQLAMLREAIDESILRVGNLKRKPKGFDYLALSNLVTQAFEICPDMKMFFLKIV